MKLNEYDDNGSSKIGHGAAVLAALLIVSVLVIVLVANKDYLKRRFGSESSGLGTVSSVSSKEQVSDELSVTSEVYVSDLSFYKDYESKTSDSTQTEVSDTAAVTSANASPSETLTEENDGKHTLITNLDGTTEWAVISPHIPKCDYDYTNLFNQSGRLNTLKTINVPVSLA